MRKIGILVFVLVLSICSVLAFSTPKNYKAMPFDINISEGDPTADVNDSSPICGDMNADKSVNALDLSYLIRYLFQGGDKPKCDPLTKCADVNVDRRINIADVIYMINFLHKHGKEPCYKLTHNVSPNSARFKPIADPTKVVHFYSSKIPKSIARYLG